MACLPVAEVEQLRRSAQAPVSLEKPIGDDDESELGWLLADNRAADPESVAHEALRTEALRDVLATLTYRDRRVLELRYGLGGERPRTLDELGRTFNVTRERIRQIENRALQQLASVPKSRSLARSPRWAATSGLDGHGLAAAGAARILMAGTEAPS